MKGLQYHINAVDGVTEREIEAGYERHSVAFLLPIPAHCLMAQLPPRADSTSSG